MSGSGYANRLRCLAEGLRDEAAGRELEEDLELAVWREQPRGGTAMIMRITWGKLRAGSWKDFEKTYNATVATKGRQIKGLRGRWLLQDMEDKDTGFAVSLWESAGEMQAYEQGDLYKQEIAPALQPFFVGDYKTYRCDVKYMQ